MHGHGYVIEVTVRGRAGARTGWVMDYAAIDAAAEPVVLSLDHRTLNDVEGLGNPTSEVLAKWIWDRVRPRLRGLVEVSVAESPRARCAYRGR
jgi:6-pyruvoyltetrahydropterin/6-carboxytetrahydropterin synthase